MTLTRFALLLLALSAIACAPSSSPPGDELESTPTPLSDDDDSATDQGDDDDDDSAPLGDDDDSAPLGDDDDSVPGGDDDDSAPTGSCPGDDYEENDDQNSATQLGSGLYTSLTSCTDDEDWYGVQVPAGEQLTVALTFLDEEGDIDVTVTDAGGAFLTGASSTTDDEIAGPVQGTGDWMFIKVRLYADSGTIAGNDYDLDLSVGAAPPPEVCPTDAFEENDTSSAATSLSAGAQPGLIVCSEDEDWYSLSVPAGQMLTASALFPHAEGDVDITLYDESDAWLASSSSTTDDEELTWTATDTSAVLLKVVLYSDNGSTVGNDYDLGITLQ